jgi:prepilin-type N-terminal cleavage/methylation domain-containing protein
MIRNQKGFTLIELIAGIALSTLLFAGFTMFLIQFVNNFKEINEYNNLQHEMLNTLEVIRYGYVKKGKNENDAMIGLLTANKVNISPNGKSVTIMPIISNTGETHWARYTLDSKGRIVLDAKYGIHNLSGEIIFPKSDEVVDKALKYKITNFSVKNVSPILSDKVSFVTVTIEGQVRFRPRGKNQNRLEDEKMNTKKATFESTVFVSNFDK